MMTKKKTTSALASSKSGKRKAVVPAGSSSDSDPVDSEISSNETDFSALIGALQSKFIKKSKDQSVKYESQMRAVIAKTVNELCNRVGQYENYLTTQLDDLKKQLDAITKQRDEQVTEFTEKYNTMRRSMQGLLEEIEQRDKEYAAKFTAFFGLMNDYREANRQSKETIQALAEETKECVTKKRKPSSK